MFETPQHNRRGGKMRGIAQYVCEDHDFVVIYQVDVNGRPNQNCPACDLVSEIEDLQNKLGDTQTELDEMKGTPK